MMTLPEIPHEMPSSLPVSEISLPTASVASIPEGQAPAATYSPSTSATFHPFPRLPLELRLMIWNLAVPHNIIPIGTVALSSTTQTPIPGSSSVEKVRTSIALLTSPDELLDSVSDLVDSWKGDVSGIPIGSLSSSPSSGDLIFRNPKAKERALNALMEKRTFERTYDKLSLTNFDTLTTAIGSTLSPQIQNTGANAMRAYANNLLYVCKESHTELSRSRETTLGRIFSPEAVILKDVHKRVERPMGVGAASRASMQNTADFFSPPSSDASASKTALPNPAYAPNPVVKFAKALEQQKGRLLAPGIRFWPEKTTIFYPDTLDHFFEECLSCPTPCTGPNIDRTPAYTTIYENIRYLAVKQDPGNAMRLSSPPRNYGARLDHLEELIFIVDKATLARRGDALHWQEVGGERAKAWMEQVRERIERWGFGAPKKVRLCLAEEFDGM